MIRDEIRKLLGKGANVEIPKEKSHGDYSSNIALVLAGKKKNNPMEVASAFAKAMADKEIFEKVEVVKPGFINFFLSKKYLAKHLQDKVKNIGKGEKVNVEFISANPTGSLTLGNARGGFGGDALANVLEKSGFKVTREFYINDRGKQVKDLKQGLYGGEKRSVWQIQKENRKLIENKLNIKFDVWFSEKSLYKNKEVAQVLALLKKKKLTYEKEGALWFKTTKFGDDKDRVLVRENGEETYLASDVAYLKDKFDRGFKKNIILVGADHHGYVKRIKASAKALGHKKEQVDFIVMQLVNLKEGKMSKRAGVFVRLEELIDEVGLDAARFFFLQRAANSHLIFDLELAKKKSQENPVYYVQYAYARICSILRKTESYKLSTINYKLLEHESELKLMKQAARFPEIVEDTAKDYQVQRLPQYTVDLAESFHRFYQECPVLTNDKKLTQNRLSLLIIVKDILKQTFDLMGISAPSKM